MLNEMLAKICRYYSAAIIDCTSIIAVDATGCVSELASLFIGQCTIAEGYNYRTGRKCTFISPVRLSLCDAVFMANMLKDSTRVCIKEIRNDDGMNKRLTLKGDYLYKCSAFDYRPIEPFIPSVDAYTSEWTVVG